MEQEGKLSRIKRFNGQEYLSLHEAAKFTPHSQEYLRLLARRGKLMARKIGRNWYTSKDALLVCFGSAVSFDPALTSIPKQTSQPVVPLETPTHDSGAVSAEVLRNLTQLTASVSTLADRVHGRLMPETPSVSIERGKEVPGAPIEQSALPPIPTPQSPQERSAYGAPAYPRRKFTVPLRTFQRFGYVFAVLAILSGGIWALQRPDTIAFIRRSMDAIRYAFAPSENTPSPTPVAEMPDATASESANMVVFREVVIKDAETPTLDQVVAAGNVTGRDVQIGSLAIPTGNLRLGSGTIEVSNNRLIPNLNAEYWGGRRASDYDLDTITAQGATTNTVTFFNAGLYGGDGSFHTIGVARDASFGSIDEQGNIRFRVYAGNFEITDDGDLTISGNAALGSISGAGLTDCSGSNKLTWDEDTGTFSCTAESGGSGLSAIQIREGAGTFSDVASISLNASHFALTASGSEATIALDWGSGGPASLSQDETVTGNWGFSGLTVFSGGASVSSDLEVSGTASVSQLYIAGSLYSPITSNSLDFDEFADAMTLDADTNVVLSGNTLTLGGLSLQGSSASISGDFEVTGTASASYFNGARIIAELGRLGVGTSFNQTSLPAGTVLFGSSGPGFSLTTGQSNTFIGAGAGYYTESGAGNTIIGFEAGLENTGSNNTYLGLDAGYGTAPGSGGNNVALGYQAGFKVLGSGSVFLGYQAGFNETGSNKLYIDNSNTSSPLIYGDFSLDQLQFNGSASVSSDLEVSGTASVSQLYIAGSLYSPITSNSLDFDELVNSATLDTNFAVASAGYATTWNGNFYLMQGNVGIGTTNPGTNKLYISGITYSSGNVNTGGSFQIGGQGVAVNSGTDLRIGTGGYWQSLSFYVNGAEAMNLDSAGNLHILNSASVSADLEIAGYASASRFLAGNGSTSTPAFSFAEDTDTGIYYTTNNIRFSISNSEQLQLTPSELKIGNSDVFGWSAAAAPSGASIDVALYRDAANTLALRNSTNAQALNIYNTYTDNSNYERTAFTWSGNVFTIGAQALGTGTQRNISISAPLTDIVGSASVSAGLEISGTASVSQLYVAGSLYNPITSNSLDFDELVDSATLDANFSVASAGYAIDFGNTTITTGSILPDMTDAVATQSVQTIGSPTQWFQDIYVESAHLGASSLYLNGVKVLSQVGTTMEVSATNDQTLSLITGGSSRVFVDNSGNVGIGTTVPTTTLDIIGSASVSAGLEISGVASLGAGFYLFGTPSVGEVVLDYVCINSSDGQIYTGTDCGTSSLRFKKNIQDLEHGLDWITQLRPVTFDWKHNNEPSLGFIAEEVASVSPLLVLSENGQIYNVHYDILTAVLANAVQELASRQYELADLLNAQGNDSSKEGGLFAGLFHDVVQKFKDMLDITLENGLVQTVKGWFAEVRTDKLCIGDTCVSEAELRALLDNADVTPLPTPSEGPFGLTITSCEVGDEWRWTIGNNDFEPISFVWQLGPDIASISGRGIIPAASSTTFLTIPYPQDPFLYIALASESFGTGTPFTGGGCTMDEGTPLPMPIETSNPSLTVSPTLSPVASPSTSLAPEPEPSLSPSSSSEPTTTASPSANPIPSETPAPTLIISPTLSPTPIEPPIPPPTSVE